MALPLSKSVFTKIVAQTHNKLLSCYQMLYLGRIIFSLGSSDAKSLKVLNLTEGGWRKGLAPKLNSHCWYDIKLAAAKNPDLSKNMVLTQDNLLNKTEIIIKLYSRCWWKDLFFWWQLLSIQVEDHLLLAEVQQEANGISLTDRHILWVQAFIHNPNNKGIFPRHVNNMSK